MLTFFIRYYSKYNMHENSVIELSFSALQNNIAFLRRLLGPDVLLSSVIKGNAYGHGIAEFVPMACRCGITHFSVFGSEEAWQAKQVAAPGATILIMGMIEGEALEWAIENEVEFFVFDMQRLQDAVTFSKKTGKPARVHIELETGMNRTGFTEKDIAKVTKLLKNEAAHLEFKGLCTHYAGAESSGNFYRVQGQMLAYELLYDLFLKAGLKPQLRHTACSAAAIAFPETRMDMVRIGILQYGLWPSPETLIQYLNKNKTKEDPLQRVIGWKSTVMSLKKVNPGDFIGYGTSYMAQQKMNLAVVPIGYAHGYSRSLSNQGLVAIKGQICRVIGTVNMNMLVADISGLKNVQKGDEVVLIGKQGKASVSVGSFSEFSNQLNYELLTRLPESTPRRVVG